ncbi:CCA-adding enzyme [Listeria sp. ILCC792]|uniref:CCA-adding enzyme n=1 Tax=Listeria sp. ILCC792 TaxID=1918331 RepID=UPI000B591F07|nr:CCA-adding enzyme [Listeria sp. ILCC792]
MTKIIFLKNKAGEQFYAKTHKQAIDGLNEATADANGLMSAVDKQKLDSLAVNPELSYILTSPSGLLFKLIVDDEGLLSTEKVEEGGTV